MNKKELKQYSSPESLAAYLKNGHRQWIAGNLYEMFRIPNDDDSVVCNRCQYLGRCPLEVLEVCKRMESDQYYEYGLRCVR